MKSSSRINENMASKSLKGSVMKPSQKIDIINTNESEPKPESLAQKKIDSNSFKNKNLYDPLLNSGAKVGNLKIEGSEIISEISQQESQIDDQEISYKRRISTITAEVNVIIKKN